MWWSFFVLNVVCLDSSVGRAKDWKSLGRQFEPVFKHLRFAFKKLILC